MFEPVMTFCRQAVERTFVSTKKQIMKRIITLLVILLFCKPGMPQVIKTFTAPSVQTTAAHLLQNGYAVASANTGVNENTITKYRNDGSVAWTKTENNGLFSRVLDIAENSRQEMYILFEDVQGDSIYGLIKTDTSGNVLWTASLEKRGMETYDAARISINNDDEVYVMSSTYETGLLYKISDDGTQLWSKNLQVDSVSSKNPAFGMLATADGGFIYAGKAGNDMYVIRLDATRNILWVKRLFDDNRSYAQPRAIIALQDGNFLITGFRGELVGGSATGMFIVKMDGNGTVLEHKFYYDSTGQNAFIPYAMCQLPGGDIKIMGCGGYVTFVDLDANLNLQRYSQWSQVENFMVSAGAFHYQNEQLLITGTDENGTSYILRNNLNLDDFCNQTEVNTILTKNIAINNKYYDVEAIVRKPPVTNYASHSLQNTLAFSTVALCGNNELVLGIGNTTPENTMNVYPNPVSSNGTININLSWNDETNMVLMNAEGRLVLQQTTSGYQAQLSTAGLPTGMYFLSVSVNEKNPITSKIIVY